MKRSKIISEYKADSDTLVRIQYNYKFGFFEALTVAINPKTGAKLQKFGNDFNITGTTEAEVKNKVQALFKPTGAAINRN